MGRKEGNSGSGREIEEESKRARKKRTRGFNFALSLR